MKIMKISFIKMTCKIEVVTSLNEILLMVTLFNYKFSVL